MYVVLMMLKQKKKSVRVEQKFYIVPVGRSTLGGCTNERYYNTRIIYLLIYSYIHETSFLEM